MGTGPEDTLLNMTWSSIRAFFPRIIAYHIKCSLHATRTDKYSVSMDKRLMTDPMYPLRRDARSSHTALKSAQNLQL